MKAFLTVVGSTWAIYGWSLFFFAYHRSYLSAVYAGIILAPSYLVLSVYRGQAIPMRVFVGVTLGFLVVIGTRIVRIDLLSYYLWVPPCLASIVALVRGTRNGGAVQTGATRIGEDEFRKLLDEHHKHDV